MAEWDPRLVELIRAAVYDRDAARRCVENDPTVLQLRTGLGETALHYLAVENYADAVQLLIDLGADVNAINQYGATALFEAELADAKEAATSLRLAGAKSLPPSWDR
jgi:ankyrin repeat protein